MTVDTGVMKMMTWQWPGRGCTCAAAEDSTAEDAGSAADAARMQKRAEDETEATELDGAAADEWQELRRGVG